jgi:hypothetical protein
LLLAIGWLPSFAAAQSKLPTPVPSQLTTLDFSAEDDERPVCQVHVKLHGELVPQ